MTAPNFPDQPRRGSTITPATIENVACLLDHAGITCRYNTVKKKVEIVIPGHSGTPENLDNVTMTKVVSLASRYDMQRGPVPDYVHVVADQRAYNPAAEWIGSRHWDGEDRLKAFFATVRTRDDYPEELKRLLLHRWLLSATAAATRPGYRGRGVLTFQGPQGIGKTSWCKALVSDPALRDSLVKLDHHMDPGNKDSLTEAIAFWIVEIGELDSSLKRDVARLKGFLTRDSDVVRRPYDRQSSEYPRTTVFVATVNDANFLVDTTGNSRWWTIAVEALDVQHGIDMQQLFAQLATELKQGFRWWLDADEEAKLAAWNARHVAVSAIAEQIGDALDHDRIGNEGLPAMTASEVLKMIGYERPTNPQAKEAGAALRGLLGSRARIKGRTRGASRLSCPPVRT